MLSFLWRWWGKYVVLAFFMGWLAGLGSGAAVHKTCARECVASPQIPAMPPINFHPLTERQR